MNTLLALLVSGAATGAIYAVMASGIVLTYETSGIFNFAHGAVAFTAAFLFFELHTGQHWPIVPSGLVSILVFGPLLGLVLDRVMLRRLSDAPVYARIVGTIGLLVALPNLGLWIVEQLNAHGGHLPTTTNIVTAPGLGPSPARHWTPFTGLVLDSDQLVIFGAALLVAVALWVLLRRTRLGLVMRASVDRRELAMLRGVDTATVSAASWTVTMVLAALGGCLLAPLFGMNDLTFTFVVLGSMAAIVFARLRSLPLAFAGGLMLGVIQNLVAGYGNDFLPGALIRVSGFRTAVPFILTIVGLVVLGQQRRKGSVSSQGEPAPPDHRAGLPGWRRRLPWAVTVAALIAYTLLAASPFWAGQVAQGLVFSIIFLSFVVVTGIGGMVSLAQATFVTTGAFVTGWALKHNYAAHVPLLLASGHVNFALAALAGGAVAMAIGALFALPVRRLGPLELALGTLSLAFVADLVVFQLNGVRNHSDGYLVNPPGLGPIHFADNRSLVVLLLAVFGVLTVIVVNLERSASGRAMFASRSSEAAARTSGLSPDRAKIAIFAVSAGIAGIGGALYTVTSSPFTNTTAPSLTGLVWLAVIVTLGIRRPAGALLAGLSYGVGGAVFPQVTGHGGTLHQLVTSAHFLPILFGLGAINLAKNPDGLLALSADRREVWRARWAGRTAPRNATAPPAGGAAVAAPPGLQSATPERSVALQLDHVSSGYGPVEVLHGLDLEVASGSITLVLGANGAGKSTLCRVVAGLLPCRSGRVLFEGDDVTSVSPHRRAERGLMLAPEARGVFPGLTVEENLSVWLRTAAERRRVYDQFPIFLDRRGQLAGLLSGGEQQLLALAVALVRPPRVLVADEPTLGLAPLAAATVCATLGRLRDQGTTVVLVEEKSALVLELADTVAVMQLGRVVWTGPRRELDAGALTAAYLGGSGTIAADR